MLTMKEALLKLKEDALCGRVYHSGYGICFNLTETYKQKGYEFVCCNCEDWKDFSGDVCYPVKENIYSSEWEGENLKLRLSLIDHLLTKC